MGSAAATLEDVLKWREVVERPSVSHARGWGPVLKEAARAAGCVRAAASVAIIPTIPHMLLWMPLCNACQLRSCRVLTTRASRSRLGWVLLLSSRRRTRPQQGQRPARCTWEQEAALERFVSRSASPQVVVGSGLLRARRRGGREGGGFVQLQRLWPSGRGRALHAHAAACAVSWGAGVACSNAISF